MASLQSKLWEFFLRPIYSRKANASAELNFKLSRSIETPFPPKMILRKNKVKTTQVKGRNIFTVFPETLLHEKVILYLHGGAYIAGITWPHWNFIKKISKKSGVIVVIADYPVAPENNYVDTFEMVMATYEVLLQTYSSSQIILMGDSAGGGLALGLAMELRKKHLPQPSKMILLSPWLDVTMNNRDIEFFEKHDTLLSKKVLISAGKYYANGTDRKNPLISPIYGDFEGLPEIHLFMGTHDLLAADARNLKSRLRNTNAGFYYYEFDKMFHVWMFFPIPEAKAALKKIDEILIS